MHSTITLVDYTLKDYDWFIEPEDKKKFTRFTNARMWVNSQVHNFIAPVNIKSMRIIIKIPIIEPPEFQVQTLLEYFGYVMNFSSITKNSDVGENEFTTEVIYKFNSITKV